MTVTLFSDGIYKTAGVSTALFYSLEKISNHWTVTKAVYFFLKKLGKCPLLPLTPFLLYILYLWRQYGRKHFNDINDMNMYDPPLMRIFEHNKKYTAYSLKVLVG